MRFRELKLRKDPRCPLCSEHPTQHGLIDYEQFCGIPPQKDPQEEENMEGFDISVGELKQRIDEGRPLTLLDVRNPQEYEIARIDGALLIPLHELRDRLGELDPAADLVVHCHHGGRSAQAVQFLRQMGFAHAVNLAGGINAWSLEIDPAVPRY